jgi:hypothetical protein
MFLVVCLLWGSCGKVVGRRLALDSIRAQPTSSGEDAMEHVAAAIHERFLQSASTTSLGKVGVVFPPRIAFLCVVVTKL